MDLIDKLVPHSIEAEVCVLGAMILDPDKCLYGIKKILKPIDFYRPAHAILFSTIATLHHRDGEVDLVLLRAELVRLGTLDEIGGIEYVVEVASGVPGISNWLYYARIVREAARKRRLIQIGGQITEDAYKPNMESEAIMDKAQTAMFEITSSVRVSGLFRNLHKAFCALDKRPILLLIDDLHQLCG